MQTTRRIPLEAFNSFLTEDRAYLSVGSALYASAYDGSGKRALKDFPGAARGLRCIHVTRAGTLFVSPEGRRLPDSQKGLWRSEDGGQTWERVLSLAGAPNPVSIWGFDETPRGWLLAGVYCLGAEDRRAEIYRSTDGGRTWDRVYWDPDARHIHGIAADPWSGAVYASIGDDFGVRPIKRILCSHDGGGTWEEILEQMPQVTAIVPTPTGRIFASDAPGGARILRSTDDCSAETVLWDTEDLYFFWMRRDSATGHLFASAVRGRQEARWAKIFRSTDDGLSWHVVFRLAASAKSDGSLFASNVHCSRLLVHLRQDAELRPSLVWDVKGSRYGLEMLPDQLGCLAERVLAAVLLTATSPLILLAALLVKSTSSGPAFFLQERHGRYSKPFLIYKLRTMLDAETCPAVDEASNPEQRVTPIGRLLRALSIDELPQLWNVVRGEMAIIGPRPHPVSLDNQFAGRVPLLFRRYSVLPGITGLAQVSGARGPIFSLEDMHRRVALDLCYIRSRSLLLDARIVVKTLLGGFLHRS